MTGERRAYVCETCFKKDDVRERKFLAPGEKAPPDCPHGHGKMTLQPNRPYREKRGKLPPG